MDERPAPKEVVWMPAAPVAVVLLLFTYFVPIGGAIIGALGLLGVVFRAVRYGWTPLTWVCLGAAIGAAIVWILIGLHAAF